MSECPDNHGAESRAPKPDQVEQWWIAVRSPRTGTSDLLTILREAIGEHRLREAIVTRPGLTDRDIEAVLDNGGVLADFVLSATSRQGILDMYSYSANPDIRGLVAFNPHSCTEIVERLAEDPFPHVRINAGHSPHLSRATRARLALHDSDPSVREMVFQAMTTVSGRVALDGGRYATEHGYLTRDGLANPESEIRVLGMSRF